MKTKQKKSTPSTLKILLVSFLVDLSDLFLNLIVAIMSGSVVMLSQTLQGGSDSFASGLMLFGYYRSKKPSDKNYPFGHGREMYFWTMISTTVMLGITASMSIYLGYQRFRSPEPITNLMLAFAMLTFGLFTNFYAFTLSFRKIMRNRKLRSFFHSFNVSPDIETKTSLVQDIMGSLASVFGIIALGIFAITGDLRFDGVGAMIIGAMIAILSIFLLSALKNMIVGRKASEETEGKIKHATLKLSEVKEVLDLKTMYLGPNNVLVNIEIHVVHKLKTREIERLVDKVKKNIKTDIPSVRHVQVELETPDK